MGRKGRKREREEEGWGVEGCHLRQIMNPMTVTTPVCSTAWNIARFKRSVNDLRVMESAQSWTTPLMSGEKWKAGAAMDGMDG